ncbi:MAG: hypothetical protein SA339_08200 [Methanomassiliicoccus sp.]|nr:hypothetical protein [Methanomassiliicoccus sp.]
MNRKLILIAVAIVAIVLVSMTLFQSTPIRTPSEKAVLIVSDLHEKGWKQNVIYGPAMNYVVSDDSCTSSMEWTNSTGMQAAIVIDLYHFNSTEAARVIFGSILSGFENNTSRNVALIAAGDAAFMLDDMHTILDVDQCQNIYVVKGSYLAIMQFGWNNSFGWTSSNITQVAQIQAEKMV